MATSNGIWSDPRNFYVVGREPSEHCGCLGGSHKIAVLKRGIVLTWVKETETRHGEQCGRITGVEATWFCTRQGNTQGRQTELPAASTTTKCTNLTANYFLQKHVQLMLVSCFLFRAETLQHCSISFYLQSAMSTSLCQISPKKWHLRGLYEIGAALRAPVTPTWKSKTCQPRLEMDSPFAPLSTNTGLTWCK